MGSLVQSNTGSNTAASAITVSFPGNSTAHNLLVVTHSCDGTAGVLPSSITFGGQNLVMITSVQDTNPTTGVTKSIWYLKDIPGGSTAVVATLPSAQANLMEVMEFNGYDPKNPLITSIQAVAPANTLQTSYDSTASGTSTPAGSLWVGGFTGIGSGGHPAINTSQGYTLLTALQPGSVTTSQAGYILSSTNAGPQMSGSITAPVAGAYWATVVAGFSAITTVSVSDFAGAVDTEHYNPNLFAAYAFNEGSGTTVTDYSGNGFNLTITGTSTWPAGHGAYAHSFQADATSGGAVFNAGTFVAALQNGVTVMAWYQNQLGSNNEEFVGGIFGGAGFARASLYGYRNLFGTSGAPQATVRDSGGGINSVGAGTSSDSGVWHHVAVTVDVNHNIILYKDGTQVATATSSNATMGATTQYWGAGAFLSGADPQTWIQDMRIFDGPLTASQIVTYMNTPVTGGGTTNITVSDFAGQVEAIVIAATVAISDAAGTVEAESESVTLTEADMAGAVDSVATAVSILLSDSAGAVESLSVGRAIAFSDAAGVMETISVSVSVPLHDVGAQFDTVFRPGSNALNPLKPAIVLVASAYAPVF